MRAPPDFAFPTFGGADPDTSREIVREVKFITPLFGGGVALHPEENNRHIKEPDEVTPLRASAVVGQVRFWWRATYGARMESIGAMREREAELFGAASSKGRVRLAVRALGATRVQSERWGESCKYATFPLQRGLNATLHDPGQLTVVEGAYECRWLAPAGDDAREVELAIDCWLAFGGAGGRTRRGFGALDPEPRKNVEEIAATLRETFMSLNALPSVPAIDGGRIRTLRAPHRTAQDAHLAAIEKMRRFRQGAGVGRDAGHGGSPGLSRWPEAHAIRTLQRRSSPGHEPPEPNPVEKFPRAAFGMPIIFKFKGKDEAAGDPHVSILTPEGSDRLASPVLFRPTQTRDGRWTAVCAVLSGFDRRARLSLSGEPAVADLTAAEYAAVAARLTVLTNPDPRVAFLDYFAS